MTKKFTIIGNPVSHSVSPNLFNAAYPDTDMMYDRSLVTSASEGLALIQSTYWGANVTAPYKEDMLQLLPITQLSEEAQKIGAVNVLYRDGDLLNGTNSDYWGVIGSLMEFNVSIKDVSCLVIGVGGAGKAAGYALQTLGANLTLVNRTFETAQMFANSIDCKVGKIADLKKLVNQASVIINTLYPSIDIIDQACLHPGQVLFDASYTGSPFLDKGKMQGCTCIDGRYWVFHQAIPCFKLFTGMDPDEERMRNVIKIS